MLKNCLAEKISPWTEWTQHFNSSLIWQKRLKIVVKMFAGFTCTTAAVVRLIVQISRRKCATLD